MRENAKVPSLTIGTAEEYVRITPKVRSYPHAQDYWDGNWVKCEVEVRIAPWQLPCGSPD